MTHRIPFGNLKIGESAKRRIAEVLDSNWISEGRFVREFEEKFAEKFGWKHAIATSSGTDAGIVMWSAVRELSGNRWGQASIVTPACAFAATANCLLYAGLRPCFADIDSTLNLNQDKALEAQQSSGAIGCQFVMNMGRSINLRAAWQRPSWQFYIVDACEGHGGTYRGMDTAKFSGADAAIYSFYTAHMIVAGEGGMICTNQDDIADLCRSIKSHGRPLGSNYFDFQRAGINAKTTEFAAAIGLEGLENFDDIFARRRVIRMMLLERLAEFPLILFPDAAGEIIAPHAMPVLLVDDNADIGLLYRHLEKEGIESKTLWGALSNHSAYQWMGIPKGIFPVAERVGKTGLHFSCSEFLSNDDIDYIWKSFRRFFS